MKQDIAGQASLAINKVGDWSKRTVARSKDWFEVQRAKYSERPLSKKPKRLEDEEAQPGAFKRLWYAFTMAKRFYPSTQTPPATAITTPATADILDTILMPLGTSTHSRAAPFPCRHAHRGGGCG